MCIALRLRPHVDTLAYYIDALGRDSKTNSKLTDGLAVGESLAEEANCMLVNS